MDPSEAPTHPPGMGLGPREEPTRGQGNSSSNNNGIGTDYVGGGPPGRSRGRGMNPRQQYRGQRGGYQRGGRGRGDREYDTRDQMSSRGRDRGLGNRQFRSLEGTVESLTDVFPSQEEGREGSSQGEPKSYCGVISSGRPRDRGENGPKFHFKEEDVMGKAKLAVGDRVEFYKFDASPGQPPRATRVRKKRDGAHQEGGSDARQKGSYGGGGKHSSYHQKEGGMFHLGVVVALKKDTYGFLLSLKTGSQYFFHFSEFLSSTRSDPRMPPPELEVGILVRFVLSKNPSTGQDIGKSLCMINENGRPQFSLAEGETRMVGRIVRKPSELSILSNPNDFGDGLIEFEISPGAGQPSTADAKAPSPGAGGVEASSQSAKAATRTALVCKKQLNEQNVHIEENDFVYFDLHRSDRADLCVAKNVVLMRKPYESFDSGERELGVISTIKGSFGFITCTERMSQVFLHFSQIPEDRKEDIKVGVDVEFRVERGQDTGRLQATDVTFAEPGSAIFEKIEEEVHLGTIVEKLPNSRANLRKTNSSGSGAGGQPFLTGLIEATLNGFGGVQKFPFCHSDMGESLGKKITGKQGDKVYFRILTDLKREKAARQAGNPGLGRRATNVTICYFEGNVAAMKGSFGFIEYVKPDPAVYIRGEAQEQEAPKDEAAPPQAEAETAPAAKAEGEEPEEDSSPKKEDAETPEADTETETEAKKEEEKAEGEAVEAAPSEAAPMDAPEPASEGSVDENGPAAPEETEEKAPAQEGVSADVSALAPSQEADADASPKPKGETCVDRGKKWNFSRESLEDFRKKLKDLKEGDHKKVSFPPSLTAEQRAFVHQECERLGLRSKSFGEGEDRHCVVMRKSRIFFHISEVLEGLDLHVGDTVEFVETVNARTKEVNARMVKRTKEAPPPQPKERREPREPREPAKAEPRPDHLKFGGRSLSTGETAVILKMRLAKGPDGTKGFAREYQESRGIVFPPEPEPVEEEEEEEPVSEEGGEADDAEKQMSALKLSVEAAPFIPASLKQ